MSLIADVPDKPKPKIKILVIDDEEGIRRMLSFALQDQGFDVMTVPTGEEGIQEIRLQKFDIVITDLTMPTMGGVEVLALVKEIDPKIEVIIITGFATLDTALQSMKQGAYDFIAKPFQIDDFIRMIKKAVEKRELNMQVDSLEELNRLKSEFLANMSHELRTPLNAIIGYTSLVLDGLYGPITEKPTQALSRVKINAQNLLHLINNVLDLSKLSAGRMPVFTELLDLIGLAKDVVDTLFVLAHEKGISLEVTGDKEVMVFTDKTKMKQILINLIANAIKFTSKGGVTVNIKAIDDNTAVQIAVTDSGIGIKQEDFSQLFSEFKQLDSSCTREYSGSGLGLSICKRLTELLKGSVKVESHVGVGSTFTVSLPIENKASSEVKGPDYSKTPMDPGKRLLLAIDDDPDVLKLLQDCLKGTGYEFVGAQSAQEGISLAHQLHPAVITLDIMMPHMDGWSTLQVLKNDAALSSIPVIMVSIMENQTLGFAMGVADYIVKPFDRQTFLDKLKRLEKHSPPGASGRAAVKVLIVNDDADVQPLKDLFGDQTDIRTARNGEEAINCIRQDRPDLLLLDMMMPTMGGMEVLEEIQKDPSLKDIRAIVLTGPNLTPEESDEIQKRVEMVVHKGSVSLPETLTRLKEIVEKIPTNRE